MYRERSIMQKFVGKSEAEWTKSRMGPIVEKL